MQHELGKELASYEVNEKELEHDEGDNSNVDILRFLGGAKGKFIIIHRFGLSKQYHTYKIIGVAKGTYDKIFDFQHDQSEVYGFIDTSISKVIEGFNCSIFAYGQTGSGKTYTMFGPNWEMDAFE